MRIVLVLMQLARPKQWVKNGFVGIPLFFSGRLLDVHALSQVALICVAFCLASSAVYVFNDLHDAAADAAHPKKRTRPIAAGQISRGAAWVFIGCLLGGAAAVGTLAALPQGVHAVLGVYLAINLGYCLGLKHVSLLEMFLVASGFVLRVLAGGFAAGILVSPWLLALTGVIALMLVVAKRRGEIAEGHDPAGNRRSLRSYNLVFLDSTISMLTGLTIVLYMIFATSSYAAEKYGQHGVLLSVPVVAFGLLRYVQVTKVFSGADDPTTLVMSDRPICISVLMFLTLFGAIVYT